MILLISALITPTRHFGASTDTYTITDGRSLVTSCRSALVALQHHQLPESKQTGAFVCMAYLSGVLGTARHATELARLRFGRDDRRLYCIDWTIHYQQFARLVLDFAQRNPQRLTDSAHKLTLDALQNAFPCR
jgi:hypothetical protein